MSAKARILLVEDNRSIRTALASFLVAQGYEVLSAADIRTAEAFAESHVPDLLVSDIQLPDGDGLDLMRSLRASRALTGIAFSGLSEDWLPGACNEAGFRAFFSKPFRLPELLLAIERALQVRRTELLADGIPRHGRD